MRHKSKTFQASRVLESLGLEVKECEEHAVVFEMDGLDCDIEADEVEENMTIQDVHNRCTMYSCCGDVLNKDIMICPSCKEHC